MSRLVAFARRTFRRITSTLPGHLHDYCRGCHDLPPVTSMGYCAACAAKACAGGGGALVGLPVPGDLDTALLMLAVHHCPDEAFDNPEACPVCVFGTAYCGECGEWMDELGTSGACLDHRITNENWVAVGCEGYVQPIVRAVWAWNPRR